MKETIVLHKKKALAPKLRFKIFDGEWKRKTLGEIAEKRTVKNRDNSINNVYTNSAVRGIINQRDYFDKDIANQNNLLNYNVVDKDDFIYNPRISTNAPVGPLSRNHLGTGVMSPLYSVFRIKNGNLDFYEIYFSTTKWHEYMEGIANYGARADRMNITTGDFYLIPLPFPSLPEQQKIAAFLSAVDEKIQHLSRKKELLEQYKKGVMQQLFSAQLRFKDENGKAYPKWEEKKLGDVGDIISGLTYSPLDIHNAGVLVLRSSNVQDRRLSFNDNVYVKVNVGGFNPVKENDILICVRNGSKNLIGKNVIIDKKNEGVAFGAFMTVFRSDYNLFLFHYFDTDNYKDEVHKNLGATINSINGSDLKKFKIPFPCKAEQKKIADFLSAIDVKIESVNKQITQTQTFKKGLLQQMFV